MLKLGKLFFLFVLIASGMGLLVTTVQWLIAWKSGTVLPMQTHLVREACAVGLLVSVLARNTLAILQRERERQETEAVLQGKAFVAHAKPAWFVLPALGIFGFGAGIRSAAKVDEWETVLICVGLMLVWLALFWTRLVLVARPGPMLRMDAEEFHHAEYGSIPWEDIVGIRLHSWTQYVRGIPVRTLHALALGVCRPRQYLCNKPRVFTFLRTHLDETPAYGELQITLNPLNQDAEHIHATALALRRANAAPLLDHWDKRMPDWEIRSRLNLDQAARETHHMSDTLSSIGNMPREERMKVLAGRTRAILERRQRLETDREAVMRKSAQRMEADSRGNRLIAVMLIVALVMILLPLF